MSKSAKARPDYEHVMESTRAEFAPEDIHERFLVETMAHARWKILLFEHSRAEAGSCGESGGKNPMITALARFAVAARKSYDRAYKELQRARKQRLREGSRAGRRNAKPGGVDFAYRA